MDRGVFNRANAHELDSLLIVTNIFFSQFAMSTTKRWKSCVHMGIVIHFGSKWRCLSTVLNKLMFIHFYSVFEMFIKYFWVVLREMRQKIAILFLENDVKMLLLVNVCRLSRLYSIYMFLSYYSNRWVLNNISYIFSNFVIKPMFVRRLQAWVRTRTTHVILSFVSLKSGLH